jgi:hypothetical protein
MTDMSDSGQRSKKGINKRGIRQTKTSSQSTIDFLERTNSRVYVFSLSSNIPDGGYSRDRRRYDQLCSMLTIRCSSCSSPARSLPRSWNSPRGILLQTVQKDFHPTSNGDGFLFLTCRHNGTTNGLDREHHKQKHRHRRQCIRQCWSIAHRNPLSDKTNSSTWST